MGGKSESKTSQAVTTQTEYNTLTATNDLGGGTFLEDGATSSVTGDIDIGSYTELGEGASFSVTDLGILGKSVEAVGDFGRRAIESTNAQLDNILDRSTDALEAVLGGANDQVKAQAATTRQALSFANKQGENDLAGVFPVLVYGGVAVAALFIFNRKK